MPAKKGRGGAKKGRGGAKKGPRQTTIFESLKMPTPKKKGVDRKGVQITSEQFTPHSPSSKSSAIAKNLNKLSAMNRFKKFIVGPVSEKAISNADYIDLKPIDKCKLLCRAYSLAWDQIVLGPLFKENHCTSKKDKQALISLDNIQDIYNMQIDSILKEMKQGELDDQEHFQEDLTNMLTNCVISAAKTFNQVRMK